MTFSFDDYKTCDTKLYVVSRVCDRPRSLQRRLQSWICSKWLPSTDNENASAIHLQESLHQQQQQQQRAIEAIPRYVTLLGTCRLFPQPCWLAFFFLVSTTEQGILILRHYYDSFIYS